MIYITLRHLSFQMAYMYFGLVYHSVLVCLNKNNLYEQATLNIKPLYMITQTKQDHEINSK